MKISITKGLDKDAAVEVGAAFKAALAYRKQLIKVLEEKVETERVSSCSKDGYKSNQWAYSMADTMGYERAMREIISLLSEK